MGLLSDALAAINSALVSRPTSKDYQLLKAQILESLGQFTDSYRILTSLKEADPTSSAIDELYVRVKQAVESGSSEIPMRIEAFFGFRCQKWDCIAVTPIIAPEEKEMFDKYTNWMKSLGAQFPKIELKYFRPHYRGIVATDTISKGDIIISVPKEGMITLRMAKQTMIGKKILDHGTSLIYPNNSLLSTYVLLEKANPKTSWAHLLEALPKSVSNFPIFFTKEEKALLTGSQFLRIAIEPFFCCRSGSCRKNEKMIAAIEELRKDMEKDYNRICGVAPEFAKVASLEDFMKTRALVNSRIFGTRIDGEENDSIVPYADMFNYKYKSDMTHWTYSAELKAFVVRAKDTIKPGEEIFVYYGNKPNSNFLQFYGFVIENNDNDEVTLDVSIDPKDPLKELKADMLEKESGPKKFKLNEKTEDDKFAHLMSYLRFIGFEGSADSLKKVPTFFRVFLSSLLLTPIQVRASYSKDGKSEPLFKALSIPPLSKENEEKALSFLKRLCEENLAKFPETLEHDMELLKKGQLTYNERNCIILRAGEKRVYRFYIQLAKNVFEIFAGKSKAIAAELTASWPKMKPYLASIQHLITN